MSAPKIFDNELLRLRLARALRGGAEDFLLARCVEDLIDRLTLIKRDFARVLDLATPSPLLARALAARGPRTLTRAATIAEPAGAWETRVVDPERLPFEAGSFDLVVSALALQFVNDLPGTLTQIRRALAPDGLFLACLAGGDRKSTRLNSSH